MREIYRADVFCDTVYNIMQVDGNRKYHNPNHIKSCFKHANTLYGDEPFDSALKLAILYHDVIYDKHPFKEWRSACKLVGDANYSDLGGTTIKTVQKAFKLIMTTENHDLSKTDDYRMIKIDLADLTIPSKTIANFSKILEENTLMYNITEEEAALASINFMSNLGDTCYRNAEIDTKDADYWIQVIDGINLTLFLNNEVLGL